MNRSISTAHGARRTAHGARRGNILAISAVMMAVVFGFTAFTVDIGFIAETRAQMQTAADAGALAAGLELYSGWGTGKVLTADQVAINSRTAAQAVATLHRVGEKSNAYLDTARDVRFGQRTKSANGQWTESWGTAPYNMAEVTVRRDQVAPTSGVSRADQTLPLFFAPVIGTPNTAIKSVATVAMKPGSGFAIPAGSAITCPLLPIALDLPTWDALINNGTGSDNYKYNANGTVTAGTDGIKEVTLYPESTASLPSGNRGTVDIGPANNSTADLSRQIRYGPNAADLAFFGGQVVIPTGGTLILNGDTGLSAGIKDDLAAIIGQPRAIPIFTSVSGPGNNAMYTIVKFVGIRILFVQLTGSPSSKKVIVQPAPVQANTIVTTTGQMQPDSIMGRVSLIH